MFANLQLSGPSPLKVSWQALPPATPVPLKQERSVKLDGENVGFIYTLYNTCV